MNKITILSTTYASNYDKSKGGLTDLDYIINLVNNGELSDRFKDKSNNACFTITSIGYRISVDDKDFFKYWNGYIFVDLDHVKNPELELEHLHKIFSKKQFYYCSQISTSGHGIHFIFYIPSKFHTKLEYYTSAGIVYELINKNVSDKSYVDIHSISHSQILKLSPRKFLVNSNFDEDYVYNELELIRDTEESYYNYVKKYPLAESIIFDKCFKQSEYTLPADIKAEVPVEIKIISNPTIVWDHNNRFNLFNTLSYFYDEPTAKRICIEISKLNKKSDTDVKKIEEQASKYVHSDKYGCSRKICKELVEVYGLDIYTTEEDIMSKPDLEINIKSNQYLSDVFNEVLENLGDVTLIELCAGGGKTTAIRDMIDDVILTEPYTSIIKNKIENDTKWDCLYSDLHLDKESRHICCTPDKLINIDDELIQNIKYVFVDESHTIFTNASFRISVMSKFINRLKELISKGIKVVLMTGTPIKENKLFEEYDFKYIKINREQLHKKNLVIQYVNNIDALKQNSFDLIDKYIKRGYKIGIPCNKGDAYVNDFMNVIKEKYSSLGELSYSYFKKERIEEEANSNILHEGKLDGIHILFSTLYMGEGIDILYEGKMKLIFFNLDVAQSLEQYCARYRKIDIDAILYLNRDVDSKGKPRKIYNFTDRYELQKVKDNDLVDVANLMSIYKRNENKWQKDIESLLNKHPYFDKETGELNEECLNLYELATSSMKFYRQFTIIKRMMESYGYVVKFYKTITDDSKAQEINSILKGSSKHRKYKEYIKALETIDKADEKEIFELHLTYKTKEKMTRFIKKLYSQGVKFEDCKRIATSICYDNAVHWSEMDNIILYAEYLFNDKVNNSINPICKEFVDDMKQWTEKHNNCTPKAWKDYKDRWSNRYCETYNVKSDNVKKEMLDTVNMFANVHVHAKQKSNKMLFSLVDYGNVLDTYYLM